MTAVGLVSVVYLRDSHSQHVTAQRHVLESEERRIKHLFMNVKALARTICQPCSCRLARGSTDPGTQCQTVRQQADREWSHSRSSTARAPNASQQRWTSAQRATDCERALLLMTARSLTVT